MRSPRSLVLAASLALPALAAAQGPTGTYYLTNGDGLTNWRVQGLSSVSSAQANGAVACGRGEYAIAVSGDVRTLANGNDGACGGGLAGGLGSQYDLSFAYTGTTYAYPLADRAFYDGTTDGTYNYGVSYNTGEVWRFDRNWSGGSASLLFGGIANAPLGITYDPFTTSLWVSEFGGSAVSHYSMSGALLGGFTIPQFTVVALAMDYSDGTLWMGSQTTLGTFYQYSTAGALLQTVSYANMAGENTLGGEFDIAGVTTTPEPATLALLATGFLAIGGAARSRRRAQ